jgi:DNA-binding MarR family transcriptional regulator
VIRSNTTLNPLVHAQLKETDMTTIATPTTLNPSIIGQAEKAHKAILNRILVGTTLDEKQWITLQVALAAGATFDRVELVAGVASAAKFDPADVEAAIAALTGAGLVQAAPGAAGQLTFTAAGRVLVENLRGETRDIIARAYGDIPAEDLATAARVLTAITAKISEELAAN